LKLYPLFLKLKNRDVLLVGAGVVAAQKIKALLACEARVRVVAPKAVPEIQALVSAGRIQWKSRGYKTTDLAGASLVIAATDDPALQKRIARESRGRKILVNCANAASLCDFYSGAIVNRGDIQIAISTGGAAPALAKALRQKIETMLGPEDENLLRRMKRARSARKTAQGG
jgi:precorrin-2 dehydrogenase/sirohydrochlorin ferrochelatase